jgi:hypothetical protein
MKIIKASRYVVAVMALFVLNTGCQKMDTPALGDYPKDANPPGGPLKFYVAFDGSTSDPLMNAVDSIRATFPSQNPLTTVDGANGKGVKGESQKFIKYPKPNEWAMASESFTVAFWEKKTGQTKNGAGTNGPEYIFSFKGASGYTHWSGASAFLFFEGDNATPALKFMTVDKNLNDHWFEWTGGESPAGALNGAWHHIALVYNAATSTMTLYVDGVANANKKTWDNHGKINLDNDAIGEFRLGAGPGTGYASDDWLSSTWKGDLDQFRMYSTALTAAEITDLFVNKK